MDSSFVLGKINSACLPINPFHGCTNNIAAKAIVGNGCSGEINAKIISLISRTTSLHKNMNIRTCAGLYCVETRPSTEN